MSAGYSPPDDDGICTRKIDIGVKRTLRGRRKRRTFIENIEAVRIWPPEWRQLLVKWIKGGGGKRKKYATIMRAGKTPISTKMDVFDALLKGGIIELEEVRKSGRWECLWVEFINIPQLKNVLGLDNVDAIAEECDNISNIEIENSQIQSAFQELMTQRNKITLKRGSLLLKLDEWISEGRIGTERDFALFARGDTKAVTSSEWKWLRKLFEMEVFNISRHTPTLLINGPVTLHFENGNIDLHAVHEFIGLTPDTVAKYLRRITGSPNMIRLVENQTSFERVTRKYGHEDIVIWLPGFPPSWWQDCFRKIIRYVQCQVLIAADPDPAGIEIAMTAGRIVNEQGVLWEPWCMDPKNLSNLHEHKDLTAHDRSKIESLLEKKLPEAFFRLATEMKSKGIKGEQEGIEM